MAPPRTWLPLACLALAGCRAISGPPGSAAPVNACGGTTGLTCEAFHGDAAVACLPTGDASACDPGTTGPCSCQVAASVNPVDPSVVLVVTVPQLAPVSGGSTYAFALERLSNQEILKNHCQFFTGPSPDVCFQLSPLQTASGGYLISEGQAEAADRYLGDLGDLFFTLPVTVSFWPMWTPPGGAATDVRLLNLPLPPVFADVGCNVAATFIEIDQASIPTCPLGGGFAPFEWLADLAPSDYAPGYTSVVEVVPPFNAAFPDLTFPVSIDGASPMSSTGTAVDLGFLPPPAVDLPAQIAEWPVGQVLAIRRADRGAFPAGWTAYLRDATTHRAITSSDAVVGKESRPRLNFISTQPPVNAELVVAPPSDATAVPTLVDTISSTFSGNEVYPALPPPLRVTGTVVSPTGTPVSASVLFYSDQFDDVGSCALGADNVTTDLVSTLRYEALVQTDDQLSPAGPVGQFSAVLPQGYYSVIIDPGSGAGYAKSAKGNTVVRANPPVCSGQPGALDGVTLSVDLPVSVTGRAVTADGRPLAAASVDFTPAAALAPTLSPGARSIGSLPCPPDGCSELWPRPFTTSTDGEGFFQIQVDPGLQYDVTVRPEDGTGWPWLVTPDRIFRGAPAVDGGAASSATMPFVQSLASPIVVPAPYFLSVSLLDPDANPLAGAEVEAYAFSGGVALVIGQALTDSTGHFSMALTTAFPSN